MADSELDGIMEEYADKFPEALPDGLPPERDVTHTFPTEPGHVPHFKPIHRLSPGKMLRFNIRWQKAQGGRAKIQVHDHMGRQPCLSRRRMAVCSCALTTKRSKRPPARNSIPRLVFIICLISCMAPQCSHLLSCRGAAI